MRPHYSAQGFKAQESETMQDDQMTSVMEFMHTIKGAGASALLTLMFTGRALTNKELCKIDKFTDKPMSDALDYLQRKGIITHHGQRIGWHLGAGMTKLPFSIPQLKSIKEMLNAIDFDELENGTAVLPGQIPLLPGAAYETAVPKDRNKADHTNIIIESFIPNKDDPENK